MSDYVGFVLVDTKILDSNFCIPTPDIKVTHSDDDIALFIPSEVVVVDTFIGNSSTRRLKNVYPELEGILYEVDYGAKNIRFRNDSILKIGDTILIQYKMNKFLYQDSFLKSVLNERDTSIPEWKEKLIKECLIQE